MVMATASAVRRRAAVWATVLAVWLLAASTAGAATLREFAGFPLNPGNLIMNVYVPDGLQPGSALVVALHGCTQSVTDYDDETGWTALADRLGFALVLPEQPLSNHPGRCFSWYDSDHATRDGGETRSIKGMVDAMVTHFGIDRRRVFVTGLSAGGAMAAVMLATYPDVFAGGGIIAGIPYGCARSFATATVCMVRDDNRPAADWRALVTGASDHTGPWPRVSVWHGLDDLIINPGNARELTKQWAAVHGIDGTPDAEERTETYVYRAYQDGAGRTMVESYFIKDMGHAVPVDPDAGCGRDRQWWPDYMSDRGVCASERLARFWGLDRPSSDGSAPPE